MRRLVAIIPARGGSKGIPKKNIMDFCGMPLIAWSIKSALASTCISDVFVTTDCDEIGEVARLHGAKVIKRPDALATDTASSESALIHAVHEIERSQSIDAVVFLQATSPLRFDFDIDRAVEVLFERGYDSVFGAAVLEDFCIWSEENDKMQSLTYDYLNRGRRQDRKPFYLENGSIYVFKPWVLKEKGNRLGGKLGMYPMQMFQSYEIDALDDIEKLEYYMKRKILKKEGSVRSSV